MSVTEDDALDSIPVKLRPVDLYKDRLPSCPLCGESKSIVQMTLEDHLWISLTQGRYQLFRCAECGLNYCDPLSPRAAEEYAGLEWYGPRWEFSALFELVELQDKVVLEIGCGEGYFLEVAKKFTRKLTGLDFNSAAIRVAKARTGINELHAEALDKLIERSPSSRFDCVAFFHMFEHVPNFKALLSSAISCLNPKGVLAFSVPSENRFALRAGFREPWDYPPHHLTRWNLTAIRILLRQFGLKEIGIHSEPLTPGYVHGLVQARFAGSPNLVAKIMRPFVREIAHALYWINRIFNLGVSGQAVLVIAQRQA